MTRAGLLLVLAVLVAGCGGRDESPEAERRVPRMPPTYELDERFGPSRELREVWVANGTFTLGATQARQEAQVTLLNGTEQVVFTLTFESGVIAAFHSDLGGCPLELTGPAPATGQELSVDCGRMEGPRTLVLEQSAGMVAGQYGVRALMWQHVQRE